MRALLLQAQRCVHLRARPEDDPQDVYAHAPPLPVFRDVLDLLPAVWLQPWRTLWQAVEHDDVFRVQQLIRGGADVRQWLEVCQTAQQWRHTAVGGEGF